MTRIQGDPPGRPREWLRLVGNVVNLSTPLGVGVALLGRARLRRGPRGLLLADGYRLPFPVAGAFTVGSVVISCRMTLERRLDDLPGLLDHEERHSWQYLYCLGLPFLPLYAACTIWSVIRTGDIAAANVFERQAGLRSGGYRERPPRPLRVSLQALAARLHQRRPST